MRRTMDKILHSYGVPAVVVHNNEEKQVRIFFQPSTSRTWKSMEPVVSPLGQIPGGQYLYIGPAEQEIAQEDEVRVAGDVYILRRAEAFRDRNGLIYWWGLCVQKGGEDTWGSQA